MGRNIVFCAVDGGSISALLPVAKLLERAGNSVTWVTEHKAEKTFASQGITPTFLTNEHKRHFKDPVMAGVVCGVSGNGIDLALTYAQSAVANGIPVVKVVDFYGTGHPHENGFAPSRLCVLDEASRRFEAKARGMPIAHVVATGSPAFDTLQVYAGTGVAVAVQMVLLVMPSNKKRVDEMLDIVLPVLSKSTSLVPLGVLVHPKSRFENDGDVEVETLYQRIRTLQFVQLWTDDQLRSLAKVDVLIAEASLVVGTTSTELVKACCLGVPNISVLPPGGYNEAVLSVRGIKRMPTVDAGATFGAKDSSDFRFHMEGSPFFPEEALWMRKLASLRTLRERGGYIQDGRNAERVAAVVEEVLK